MYDQLSERHYRRIAQIIGDRVGIRLPPAKRTMVEGRLRKRVRMLGFSRLDEYCEAMFDQGWLEGEFVHLVDLVTTNKTDFFREPEHFEFLCNAAVPRLLNERPSPGNGPIKIWSAASSIGAEAYTIAMVLADLSLKLGGFRFSILGTDVSTQVLAQGESAIYPEEMTQAVPPELRYRYIMRSRNPRDRQVRIVPELRRLVRFRHLNLMDSTYPIDQDVDVIFCRNILIYFERATQHAVLQRLCSHLRPGGYLFLGHSESAAGGALPQMQPAVATVLRRAS